MTGDRESCARWRDAISAGLDGEDPGIDTRLVDAHVARCTECRAFAASGPAIGRPSAAVVAESAPDLSRHVARLAAIADRSEALSIVRALLALVAAVILVTSIPALVLGEDAQTSSHDARHLGAFTVAYAVGLLVVVVRPARARTLLPVAAVLAGALLVTAVVDLVDGRVPLVDEARHLPEMVSVVLVWLVAVPSPRWPGRSGAARGPAPALRILDGERRAG